MGLAEGRNAGITGIVDLPGQSAKFNVWVRGWGTDLSAQMMEAAGRGDTEWPEQRPLSMGGMIIVNGSVRLDASPLPDKWRGERGSLVVTQHTGSSITYIVRVVREKFDKSTKEQGLWDATLVCQIIADPVTAGFGTIPSSVAETLSDKELWAGIGKTIDPQGLQTLVAQRFLWWGIGDNDTAELAKIGTFLSAAAAPVNGLKLRPGVFHRLSKNAATFDAVWGLTDTAEDVVNPSTVENIDPQKLQSGGTVAAINATPAIPALPGQTLVERTTATRELNDAKTLNVKTYGQRDTKDDVEMPGSIKNDDPYDLSDQAAITLVTASSASPTTPAAPLGQLVEIEREQLNRDAWRHTFRFRNLNSEQAIEFPAATIETDPSALQDVDRQADVTDSSTPPSTPTPRVTDLKLRVIRSQRVGGTPEKWLHTWEFGRRTTQQDIEMPGTITGADISGLRDSATITQVTASSSPPSTPAAPLGQIVKVETEQLHGSDGGRWRHTFTYANTTAQQEVEFAGTVYDDDQSTAATEDEDRQAFVRDDETAISPVPSPRISGLNLRTITRQRLGGTPEKWKHAYRWTRRSSKDDIEMPGTVKRDDQTDIKDEATVTITSTNSDPTAVLPSTPLGLLVGIDSEKLWTNSGGTTLWKYTFRYANNTSEDEIAYPQEMRGDDPANLEDEDVVFRFSGTATPPADPGSNISGLKLRVIRSRRLSDVPEKWQHRFEYGRRTTAEDVTMPGTVTSDEVSDIADEATVTLITASSTPPAAPAAPVGQLLAVESTQLHGGGDGAKWKHVFRYGNTTALQRIQFPTDTQESDPRQLEDEDHQSQTTASSTPPATPSPRIAGLVLRSTSSVRIAGTPEKWLHRWLFTRRTTEEDVTFPGTVTTDEISDIADDATVTLVTSSSTAPATPLAPVGQLLEVRSEQLTDAGKWKHTFHFGNTTALQHLQFPTDTIETDPSALSDEDRQSQTTASSTVPAAPATRISGAVLRSVLSRRISGTPEKWLHQWTFGRRSTEQDVTFPGTVTSNEVSDIADDATITLVTSSGTAPSTPAAPLGQLLEVRSEQLTAAGKWKHTFRYGNTTELQKITFPTDVQETDPQGLRDEDHQSQTTGSSTVPATPATRIAGCVLRTVRSRRIAGTPEQWLHEWTFGRRSTAEDETFPGTITQDDVADLADRATITQITASSTPPSTPAAPLGQLVETRSEQLTDAGKWKHTFSYENTTSAQKAQFPNDRPDDDPQNLEDSDVQAQVTTSLTPPSTPTPRPSALKLRSISSQRIGGTPAQYLHVWKWGRRNTKEDIEFPGTISDVDQYSIDGTATIRQVTASSTPPSTPAAPLGECVSIETVQVHAGSDGEKWQHTFKYAQVNSQQRLTFPLNVPSEDPSTLRDEETQATVTTNASESDPSATIAGLVLRVRRTRQVSGTPAYYLHIWEFGRRSTQDDVEMPGTVKGNDPNDLADRATITQVNSSSTPPATPAAPVGELVEVESEQLHAAAWRHTFRYANIGSAGRVTYPESPIEDDPADLSDSEAQTLITSSATAPATPTPASSGLKLRRRTSRRVSGTPEKWAHRFEFARRDTKDDVEMPGTITRVEVSDLRDTATITLVTSSSAPPIVPLAPVGQLLETESEQLHPTKWRHTFKYGTTTAKQEVEFDGSETDDDPQDLIDGDVQTIVNGSSTPPATPTPSPSTLKLRRRTSKRLAGTPEKWRHRFEFGRRNTVEDEEMPGTVTRDDPYDLADTATITSVTTSSSAGTPPAAPVGEHLETRSEQLYSGRWKHTFTYGNLNSRDRVLFEGATIEDDPSDLSDTDVQKILNSSSTPDADPATRVSGLKIRRRVSRRIGGTPQKWEHAYHFARRNAQDEVEMDGTASTADTDGLGTTAEITQVTSSGTAPSTPASPSADCTFIEVVQKQLHDTRWSYTFRYGPRTRKQAIEQDGTETTDDPLQLQDSGRITQVTTSGTPPAIPSAPSGTVHRRTTSVQLKSGQWKHTFEYGERTTQEDVEFEGTESADDPQDLADTATLTQVTSSATPPTAPASPLSGAKLIRTSTQQKTQDRWAHTFHYGPRSSKDEIEFGGTTTRDDPVDLLDSGTITSVTASSTPPSIPTAPAGTKHRQTETQQLTDGKWRHTFSYSRRSSKDEVEQDGTRSADDAADIADSAEITQVTSSGTPPAAPLAPISGTKLIDTLTRQLHDTRWAHTFKYGRRDRKDEIEQDGSSLTDDAGDLADEQTITQVTSSSTPPATPTAPTNTVLIDTTTRQLHATRWRHTFRFGAKTTKQAIEYGGTSTTDDPSDLTDSAEITLVTASATAPSIPAAPLGELKHNDTTTRQLTSNRWAHTFKYATTTSADRETFPHNWTSEDSGALESTYSAAAINDTPSVPGGYHERTIRTKKLTDGSILYISEGALRTSVTDIEYLQSKSVAESGAIEQRVIVAKVTSSSTPDSTGLNPDTTNLSLYWSDSHQVTDAKYVHIFEFRPLTPTEAMTAQFEGDSNDPASLEDENTRVLYGSSTTPSAAPAISGKVNDRIEVKRVGKVKYRYTYRYSYRSSVDKLTAEKARTTTDLSGLETTAITAAVYSGGEPGDPSPPVTGYQLIDKTDLSTPNPSFTCRVYRWGLVSNQQKIEYDQTRAEANPLTVYEKEIASIVDYSGTAQALADSLSSSNATDKTFLSARVQKITPSKALQILRHSGEDKSLHSAYNHVQRELVRGVPASAIVGGQYLPGNIFPGDTGAYVYVFFNSGNLIARPQMIWRAQGGFRLRRVFTTADPSTYFFLAVRGTVNNANFLGYSAGEVMYAGPAAVYTYAIAGVHRVIIDYEFSVDQWRFFGDSWLPEGRCAVNSGSILSSGLYNATQLDAGLVCNFPSQSSFAGFLTP